MGNQKKGPAILLWPLAAGLLAQLLFFLQGGFGAGHGSFDLIIFLLMLPSILLLPILPSISLLERSDLFTMIWLPMLLNTLIFRVLQFFSDLRKHERQSR